MSAARPEGGWVEAVGDMTTKQSAALVESTGVTPHFRRLLRRYAATGGARGLWRGIQSVGTHLALCPLGFVGAPLRAREPGNGQEVYETPIVQVHGYFHNRSGFFFM